MPTRLDIISALFCTLVLTIALTLVVIQKQAPISVKSFELENLSEVSPDKKQWSFLWSEDVDPNLIEQAIKISPAIPYKISWLGKKMVLTLDEPMDYNTHYKLEISPFYETEFKTKNASILAIERTQGNNALIQFNLEKQEKEILTPNELWVVEYQKPKNANLVYFFASEKENYDPEDPSTLIPELYKIDLETKKITQLTQDSSFLNFHFRSSEDGNTVILDRLEIDPKNGAPKERHLWITKGASFKRFWSNALSGDNLFFTPDGRFLIGIDLQNFMMVSIEDQGLEPQLLGSFNEGHGISPDGKKALFLQWKDNNIFAATNEIVLLGSDGTKKILGQDLGVIESPIFDENSNQIYFGLTPVGEKTGSLMKIHLETGELSKLSSEDFAQVKNLSLSLDGKTLFFECNESEICMWNFEEGKAQILNLNGESPTRL